MAYSDSPVDEDLELAFQKIPKEHSLNMLQLLQAFGGLSKKEQKKALDRLALRAQTRSSSPSPTASKTTPIAAMEMEPPVKLTLALRNQEEYNSTKRFLNFIHRPASPNSITTEAKTSDVIEFDVTFDDKQQKVSISDQRNVPSGQGLRQCVARLEAQKACLPFINFQALKKNINDRTKVPSYG